MKCPHCSKEVILVKSGEGGSKAPSSQADASELNDLLARIDDNVLDGAAVKFVAETRERFEKYGERTRVSERQLAWLKKLADDSPIPF